MWGGKEVSADGTRPNPRKVDSILGMGEPQDASELMNFVYGVVWFRGNLSYFAEIAGPLYDTINEALSKYKKKTSTNARKVKLEDLPSWREARGAF